jgi:phage terminase small subunit
MSAITERTDYGPAMSQLNERRRAFVIALLTGEPGHGCLTRACLAAGYQPNGDRALAGKGAYKLSRDERVLAAISEEAKKLVRVHHPEASLALLNVIRNPENKDHVRALAMVLDRGDPVNTHHSMTVVHKTVDPDQEALAELRAARHLGASREKLIELFGFNGLERLEALEAVESAQRAASAKLIEGKAEEVRNDK